MSSNRDQDVKYIKDWMQKEAHLPDPFDDEVILKFLHSNYYSLEQTKKCIDRFCTSRHNMPQIYTQRDPLETNIQSMFLQELAAEYTCGDNEIFIFKLGEDVNKFNFNDTAKSISLRLDYWVQFERHLPVSHRILIDVRHITMKHLSKLNPVLLKDFVLYLLEGMPVRIKKVMVINAPPITDIFYNLVKPVLPLDLVKLIHISPDDKCLEELLDKKSAPTDYGGEGKSISERSMEYVDDISGKYREMFKDDNLWKGDATKIPKRADTNNMNGSFRALAID